MRPSELSKTISTKAESTALPAPSCSGGKRDFAEGKTVSSKKEAPQRGCKAKSEGALTCRRAWRSSERMFWNRSLRTKRMAAGEKWGGTKTQNKGREGLLRGGRRSEPPYFCRVSPWKKLVFPAPFAPTAQERRRGRGRRGVRRGGKRGRTQRSSGTGASVEPPQSLRRRDRHTIRFQRARAHRWH